ncbi:type II secretion system protein N [Biformimicrobium ophioploci]|uniref:Type II secretion system protein GspC N-terminal domain-containing protein n=1 Tax=Biformimicrobium ophioploci TaxID=3036711 RepID=A0ABQ6M1K7_9GAMM|nr:type II secretion system protein N [Microbulbifer sp. NKW57]GMG88244.1 hypothetical protein MNKW57_25650 [Microbulbifer sp. NKW57]
MTVWFERINNTKTGRWGLLAVAGLLFVGANVLAYGDLFTGGKEDSGLLVTRKAVLPQSNSNLPRTSFFGTAKVEQSKKPKVPAPVAEDLPVTRLNLVLSGVLSHTQADRASALIAEKGKAAKRYFVGDAIPGGVQLHSVDVNHVVLQRADRLERLNYPDYSGRASLPQNTNTSSAPRTARRIDTGANSAVLSPEQRRQSMRERLKQRQAAAQERMKGNRQPDL